jgi:hypothetical protein
MRLSGGPAAVAWPMCVADIALAGMVIARAGQLDKLWGTSLAIIDSAAGTGP